MQLPWWKVIRELQRVGQQLRGVGEALTDPVKQQVLDRTVANGLPLIQGVLPASDRIALMLIYQPRGGVAESILATCSWLSAAGYAPFVVSNAPISLRDRERLRAVTWRAVERPNFGYDFGGYRDGLSCLNQWGVAPEELLILNDSIWLPVLPTTDLLDRLSRSPADIAGTILRTRGSEQFLESYLYRIKSTALKHPSFKAYWAHLRLTSNKYYVIRRGERGFSSAMRAAGLTIASVYDSAGLPMLIEDQDDDFLRKTLYYAAYVDAHHAAERNTLLRFTGANWRAEALRHVNRLLESRLGYSTFPYAMVHLTGYPVLKKSNEPISRSWRLAHLTAVEQGDLPSPPDTILSEIKGLDARSPRAPSP